MRIPFNEVKGCDIIYGKKSGKWLAIFLNEKSPIKRNLGDINRSYIYIIEKPENVVALDLESTKIKAIELKRIILAKIS